MSTQVQPDVQIPDQNLTIYPVPSDFDFDEVEKDFLTAPDLEDLAKKLYQRYSDFDHLNPSITDTQFTVTYLWKRKGGESGGKTILGKCVRPTGLLKQLVGTNYVIWVAADSTRGRLNRRQMEALLFHEMLHTCVGEKGEPATVGHDFEGFVREIAEYGTWRKDIEPLALAFAGIDEQESLFEA